MPAAERAGSPAAYLAAGRPGLAVAEVAIRVFGGVAAVWFGAFSAAVEALAVPLRVGTVRIPVAVLFAAGANVGMMLFARWVTRSRVAALLPGLAWFVVVMAAGNRTREGDLLLIGDDWVAMALLLVGSASVAAGGYFAVMGPVNQQPPLVGGPAKPRNRGASAVPRVNPDRRPGKGRTAGGPTGDGRPADDRR